jgi:hypothetical protein
MLPERSNITYMSSGTVTARTVAVAQAESAVTPLSSGAAS